MTRRCSHCSNNGHNSRTCPSRSFSSGDGVKLFGVRLTDGSIIKKSASMGNLSAHYHSSSSAAGSPNPGSPSSDPLREQLHEHDGYLSDDPAHASCSNNPRSERKKGVPWTEGEHRMFLIGLQKLGKGDWRGIARNYVVSRTPTQVASHAQKYFVRQSNATRRKRRSSLFDMVTDTPTVPEEISLPACKARESDNVKSLPSLNISLQSNFEEIGEPMEDRHQEEISKVYESGTVPNGFPPVIPGFAAYLPVPYQMWPPIAVPLGEEKDAETSHHQVLKPIPVFPKEPVNVDELVGMSELSLGEAERSLREPSPLSLKLLGEPSRQSAFHINARVSGSDLSNARDNRSRTSSHDLVLKIFMPLHHETNSAVGL